MEYIISTFDTFCGLHFSSENLTLILRFVSNLCLQKYLWIITIIAFVSYSQSFNIKSLERQLQIQINLVEMLHGYYITSPREMLCGQCVQVHSADLDKPTDIGDTTLPSSSQLQVETGNRPQGIPVSRSMTVWQIYSPVGCLVGLAWTALATTCITRTLAMVLGGSTVGFRRSIGIYSSKA